MGKLPATALLQVYQHIRWPRQVRWHEGRRGHSWLERNLQQGVNHGMIGSFMEDECFRVSPTIGTASINGLQRTEVVSQS